MHLRFNALETANKTLIRFTQDFFGIDMHEAAEIHCGKEKIPNFMHQARSRRGVDARGDLRMRHQRIIENRRSLPGDKIIKISELVLTEMIPCVV